MKEVPFNQRVPHSQVPSHLHRSRPLLSMSLALLAVGYMLTPHPSLASTNLTGSSPGAFAVNCSSAPVASSRQCHLDLNDKMKMELGTWGNGVHPRGPNYFCVEHRKQLAEERNRGCR
jgi:hypothetical protein